MFVPVGMLASPLFRDGPKRLERLQGEGEVETRANNAYQASAGMRCFFSGGLGFPVNKKKKPRSE
jgi:hypothetical protein